MSKPPKQVVSDTTKLPPLDGVLKESEVVSSGASGAVQASNTELIDLNKDLEQGIPKEEEQNNAEESKPPVESEDQTNAFVKSNTEKIIDILETNTEDFLRELESMLSVKLNKEYSHLSIEEEFELIKSHLGDNLFNFYTHLQSIFEKPKESPGIEEDSDRFEKAFYEYETTESDEEFNNRAKIVVEKLMNQYITSRRDKIRLMMRGFMEIRNHVNYDQNQLSTLNLLINNLGLAESKADKLIQ